MAAAAVIAAGSLAFASPAHAAPACTTTGSTVSCEFSYLGAPETWTVPAGVVEIDVDLYGAEGGNVAGILPGGRGGRATATLAVTPGQTVTVAVGGEGGSVLGCGQQTVPGAGGFNGGGTGGDDALGTGCEAPGGGGASDIRFGGTGLADRVLVAGGGGGSANGLGVSGGAGGGLVGEPGSAADSPYLGGAGGTQVGGGSGLLGDGGSGQGNPNSGGGGGGGGYYGGAGGTNVAQAGGGGGSGYGPTGTVFETGVRSGNGSAVISYALPATATTVSAFPNPVTVGTPVDLSALVTSPAAGVDLSGTVDFLVGGVSVGVANVITGSGSAVLAGVLLPEGTHTITAVYSGGAGAAGSTTVAPVTLVVNAVPVVPPVPPTPPNRELAPTGLSGGVVGYLAASGGLLAVGGLLLLRRSMLR